jgi:hypothetical protein
MDFYSSVLYYIILVVLLLLLYIAWHDTKILSQTNEPSWIIVGFFALLFLGLFLYPSFAELDKDDYYEIKNFKEQYPELNNHILKILDDNKITINEGISILNKAKDIENQLEKKRALEEQEKDLQELEEFKQTIRREVDNTKEEK